MAAKPLKVVILAAGKSTRMKSDTPKVLHKLAGLPVLQWVLNQSDAMGAEETIVIVGHEGDRVREKFKDRPNTRFVTQEPQQGTGHAVMQARDALAGFNGDVAVLCGDVPLIRARSIELLRHMHRTEQAAATVLTTLLDNPQGYGRVIRDGLGRARRIVEQKDLAQSQEDIKEVNTGTYVFDCAKLLGVLDKLNTKNAQNEYYLTDVVPLLADSGNKVAACACDDPEEVMGINNRKQLAVADGIARRRIIDELMIEHGVTVYEPSTTYIEAGCKIGRDTTIYPHTVIRAGVEIGEHCEIGPFAHLRPGTKLGNHCKVGAFVETKNAVYGDGSKSGHLAYMGDVTLGKGVNIGAGSIVANYDGENKHHTEVGDNAFIGCGTVLVAPVKVGKNAQTGANTVVPHGKDVPDDTIVVGAPARELRKKS
ncbi:MAG: bifunctional N-acetylglucosamine-1-phosphate uridyltransferase/glucosamine-1-phosphate acetyltransferase [Planctomycetes bacterium]|nr:bifunctional N-acetylglucosamine-1-phosphate uridyltransferase/glucosamine-1-phosphate acetyltransferase [Planctomycetota bacterium]